MPRSPVHSVRSLSTTHQRNHYLLSFKRQHDASSDLDDDELVVSKAQRITTNPGRPKAADYDDVAKELILSAANTYRALIVSQGAFPTR